MVIRIYLWAAMLLCVAGNTLTAQKIIVKQADKSFYFNHKVVSGNTLFGLGRTYNVNRNSLADYNKIDREKGLDLGQIIKIPLTADNFIQTGNTGVPVYYSVGSGETLSAISSKAKNIPVQKLKDWNNISGNAINKGDELVIGFLKGTTLKSITLKTAAPSQEKPDAQSVEEVVKTNVEKVAEKTPEKTPEKVPEKTAEIVVKEVLPDGTTQPVITDKKDEPKNTPPQNNAATDIEYVTDEGYFKNHYEYIAGSKSGKVSSETVTSGIFRVTSGESMHKYYLLMDKIAAGSVVKVLNPQNNKVVYAKVLGTMEGIRQNKGYDIRISQSAASVLGITDFDKFVVQVTH